MASVDLSLDDIIQKRYPRSFNRGRGGGARRGQQRRLESRGRGQNQNNTANKRSSGVQGRGNGLKSGVSDARLRIIQKNRQKMTDAREKLVQMAKQTDARVKLEKIRERRMEAMAGIRMPRSNVSITRRTGRNGQITLTTGRKSSTPVIRRTVTNDLTALPPPPLFGPPMQRNLYTWVNPVAQDSLSPTSSLDDLNMRSALVQDHASLHRSAVQPTNIKVVARNVASQKHPRTLASDSEWNYDSHSARRGRIEILDSDEESHVASWPRSGGSGTGQLVGRMSSELKARLDSPNVVPRTMGILSSSSNSTTTSTPTGHRIVVSNLQPSVTHEDIRELFEDIGPLMTSRLVRPGTAEVVYENHKDAVKAVDVYHNRQLDGQPMKCMLVNARPPTSSSGRGVNSGSSFKLPSGGKSSVVPDVGTIHKALFNKS
ncbi:hypothetical protein R5R35_012871 [Gryllus longicercus]|uniref:RRM domain-containing protein n=1 Tax=Gryllus longicercus TaxID=2509291 RepID=A0AAN9VQA4_9ORTH|nr:Polymerase delta-interacting protein 3 [Gryllus bimaculatus]